MAKSLVRGYRVRNESKAQSMVCKGPSCDLPHEFLQHKGKYYCLECYDKVTQKGTTTDQLMEALSDVGGLEEESEE